MRPKYSSGMWLVSLTVWVMAGCATRDSGYRITNETVAFIQPGTTTRAEVVENLGPPLLEIPELRVSAYSWGKVRAVGAKPVPRDERLAGRPMGYSVGPTPVEEAALIESQRWVYAIAWDDAGHVRRAEKIELPGAGSLERAVRDWAGAVPQ